MPPRLPAPRYVLHILAELDSKAADNVDAVIYGHSHQEMLRTAK
jgi:predicted phosphodiesterase